MRNWVVAAVVVFFAPAAHAACDPAAANNVTATCTGVTTNQGGGLPGSNAGADGYGTGAETNLTVNVVGGASVSGTNLGVNLNTGAVFNGAVIAGGLYGVHGTTSVTVDNSGTIQAGNTGIFANGTVDLKNTGTISGGGRGVNANFVNVFNSGSISGGANGIAANVANIANAGSVSGGIIGLNLGTGTVTNSGLISGSLMGIAGATLTLSNSGSIRGVDFGISAGLIDLNNSGTIVSATDAGVLASLGTIVNSGTIAGAEGVVFFFGAGSLTNSGMIQGTGGTAIQFTGAADTLTLLPGSRILGAIDMGGGADVVNVRSGPDLSWRVALGNFTGTVNNIGAAPLVVANGVVATLDPTGFGLSDRTLGDFTRGISGVVASRFGAFAGGADAALALAAPDGVATWYADAFEAMAYAGTPTAKAPTQVSREGTAVWARAFGGHRDHDGTDSTLPAISTFGGAAIGIDYPVAGNLRLGAFVGGGATRLNIAAGSGGTDTDILFGGVSGGWRSGNFFVDAALHAGHLDNRNTRRIAGNLAPAGFETATAAYNGWYVSPELGAGIRFALAPEWSLTPAARVRYVHAGLDGYAETGSSANLAVEGRTLETLEERFDLTLSRRQAFATGDVLTTSIHAGVLGMHRLGGDTVNTVLLGVNLPFAMPGEDNVAGLYGGGGFEWRLKPNVGFFGAGEAILMSDNSAVIHGKGGLRVAF